MSINSNANKIVIKYGEGELLPNGKSLSGDGVLNPEMANAAKETFGKGAIIDIKDKRIEDIVNGKTPKGWIRQELGKGKYLLFPGNEKLKDKDLCILQRDKQDSMIGIGVSDYQGIMVEPSAGGTKVTLSCMDVEGKESEKTRKISEYVITAEADGYGKIIKNSIQEEYYKPFYRDSEK